ncbi:MAG: hypothetical protein IJR67_01820 [Acholeplasmatales bacterium]|nr:hypothetical protein [Acholeplasmatales bacterium]
MCYILAKDVDKHGCVALKMSIGNELAELAEQLDEIVKGKHIQIVTISRPIAYGEYSPYHFVETKDELIAEVSKM